MGIRTGAGCNRVAVKVDMNLVFDRVGFYCLSAVHLFILLFVKEGVFKPAVPMVICVSVVSVGAAIMQGLFPAISHFCRHGHEFASLIWCSPSQPHSCLLWLVLLD